MNTKLVESLIQVIEALPPEDYILLQGQLNARNIQKTEGFAVAMRGSGTPVFQCGQLFRCNIKVLMM
jgi:hypothetical protein